jgi:hypothetical protein
MRKTFLNITGLMLLAALSVLTTAPWGLAADKKIPINTDEVGVAIKGYDTVAYFTDNQAVKGTPEFETLWQDARWHFASAEHRDMFKADPERYAPQYGGY